MITLDLDNEMIEQLRQDIPGRCWKRFTFPEYLPALGFKLFSPSDSTAREKWLATLDSNLRTSACTDCICGMLLAYPLMDGPVAREMFFSILTDSAKMNPEDRTYPHFISLTIALISND